VAETSKTRFCKGYGDWGFLDEASLRKLKIPKNTSNYIRQETMISQQELEELIRKTIMLYNRYRSPEAVAKVVTVAIDRVTIAFSGSFCYSCGVVDYLEGFVHEFKILTDKAELKIDKTRQTSPRSFEADYKVKPR